MTCILGDHEVISGDFFFFCLKKNKKCSLFIEDFANHFISNFYAVHSSFYFNRTFLLHMGRKLLCGSGLFIITRTSKNSNKKKVLFNWEMYSWGWPAVSRTTVTRQHHRNICFCRRPVALSNCVTVPDIHCSERRTDTHAVRRAG